MSQYRQPIPSLLAFQAIKVLATEKTRTLTIEGAVPADILAAARHPRFRSREEHALGDRLLSAFRCFGGHVEGVPIS